MGATPRFGLLAIVPLILALGELQGGVPRVAMSCFDQVNRQGGSLSYVRDARWDDQRIVRVRFAGRSVNGFARGVHEVNWWMGDEVSYGAWLFLWPGFHDSVEGQVDLLRWDNWPTRRHRADWGGISIFGSDRRARLLRFRGGPAPVDELVGPFDLPEGRWFRLVVRQRLGAREALSVVELDGREIGRSSAPNAYGRPIQRVRYGIVAVGAGSQERPLQLLMHGADAAPRRTPLRRCRVTSGRRSAGG